MGLRKRKPTSPARRFQTVSDFCRDHATTSPEKSLVTQKTRTGGRNNKGRKTARHRGGGHKQRYRVIDFRRTKDGVPAKVATIEYDPNRNCRIALLHLPRWREALHPRPPERVGWRRAAVGTGRRDPPGQRPASALHPRGYHHPQRRAEARWRRPKWLAPPVPAVQLVAKEGDYATLRLPSTEMRRVPIDCRATVGQVGNSSTS
jgi:large subunit ribosomal protein L2